jgi:uroporphyrinogen-III synthase
MSDISSICLFKSEKEDDAYRSIFESAGFEVTFEPVLDFEFVNEELLANELCSVDSIFYHGLVATSSRSLEAIERLLSKMDPESLHKVQESWKTRLLFAVGDVTASASPIPFSQVISVASDAIQLGEAIINYFSQCQEGSKPWKLLFPCSNIRRDVLPNMLSKPGLSIELREIVAYNTKKIQCLNSLSQAKPQWWAFFSPSGVNAVFDSIPLPTNDRVKIAAIGNTTADALLKLGVSVHAVASKPTPAELLKCIQTVSSDTGASNSQPCP